MKTVKGKYVEGTVDEINGLFAGKPMKTETKPTHLIKRGLRRLRGLRNVKAKSSWNF
jgi:hypothetical protein